MIVTLGMRISNYVYNETDKCKDIIKNVDEKMGDQRRIQAYIPDTWRFMSDYVEGEYISREQAQEIYDRTVKDMQEKYNIDIGTKYIGFYAFSVLRLFDTVYWLMGAIPSDLVPQGTDFITFLRYRQGEFEERNLLNDVNVVGNSFRRLQLFLENGEGDTIESAPWYEAMETQCRHYSNMRDYLYRVLLYQKEAIRMAKGCTVRVADSDRVEFIGIEDVDKLFDEIYELDFRPYTQNLEKLPEEWVGTLINKYKVQGMTANDSPMNDNKMNGIIMSGMLLGAAVVLCLIILFVAPGILIETIGLMVLIEAINIIPQILKNRKQIEKKS